jgi:hypothetical protein
MYALNVHIRLHMVAWTATYALGFIIAGEQTDGCMGDMNSYVACVYSVHCSVPM